MEDALSLIHSQSFLKSRLRSLLANFEKHLSTIVEQREEELLGFVKFATSQKTELRAENARLTAMLEGRTGTNGTEIRRTSWVQQGSTGSTVDLEMPLARPLHKVPGMMGAQRPSSSRPSIDQQQPEQNIAENFPLHNIAEDHPLELDQTGEDSTYLQGASMDVVGSQVEQDLVSQPSKLLMERTGTQVSEAGMIQRPSKLLIEQTGTQVSEAESAIAVRFKTQQSGPVTSMGPQATEEEQRRGRSSTSFSSESEIRGSKQDQFIDVRPPHPQKSLAFRASYSSAHSSRPSFHSSLFNQSQERSSFLNADPLQGSLLAFWDLDSFGEALGSQCTDRFPSQIVTPPLTRLQWRRGGTLGSIVSKMDKLATNPMSRTRITWDTTGMVLIFYDLVFLPMQLVFELPIKELWTAIAWVAACYWTFDIPFSFCTGFHRDGVLEVRVPKMARHYALTWLVPDAVVVTCDWIYLIFAAQDAESSGDGSEGGTRTVTVLGRFFRMLRILRLVRLLKLNSFLNKMLERITSEYILTMVRVMKVIVFIIFVNHFIACGWYAVGKFIQQEGRSWIKERFDEEDGIGYRYTTSLHWSLTQFTPASMEVVPTNWVERTYNVFMLLFALVTFSSFLGTITEAMTNLRRINATRDNQYSTLRQYFSVNEVSVQLTARVWRYLHRSLKTKNKRNTWNDVSIFRQLPEVLQAELKQEVYMPVMVWYPFFHMYNEVNAMVLRAVCHKALEETAKNNGQAIFEVGELALAMYFIMDGSLDYYEMDSHFSHRHVKGLKHGTYIADAAVWLHFLHSGTVIAQGYCVLLVMVTEELLKALRLYKEALEPWRAYALLFLQENQRTRGIAVSDLPNQHDDIQDLAHRAFDFGPIQEASRENFEPMRTTESSTPSTARISTGTGAGSSARAGTVRRQRWKDLLTLPAKMAETLRGSVYTSEHAKRQQPEQAVRVSR